MSAYLGAALHYASLGWSVFPLKPRSKEPLTAHGFFDATSDEATIRAWWMRCPNANVAARAGVVFDVIDCDGDEGFRTLAGLVERHGALDAGAIACTPGKVRNGAHVGAGAHYLVAPTGFGAKAGEFGPGLEMKGTGGYVVLPPSVHPDGTGRYEWVLEPTAVTEYPPAPAWVFEHFRRKEERRSAELERRERNRAARANVPASGESVMERFNREASWRELLEPAGWTYSHSHGGNEYWVRPGKTVREGHSASISDEGNGCLYVFSNETTFEQNEAYSKFAAYAHLRHGGDMSQAARTLAAWWRSQASA